MEESATHTTWLTAHAGHSPSEHPSGSTRTVLTSAKGSDIGAFVHNRRVVCRSLALVDGEPPLAVSDSKAIPRRPTFAWQWSCY